MFWGALVPCDQSWNCSLFNVTMSYRPKEERHKPERHGSGRAANILLASVP